MDTIFKNTLRAELDFQDIKLKELASRTGISQRTLEGYVNTRSSIPPADVAVKIADALGVSVEYLVRGKENVKKTQNQDETKNNSLSDFINELPITKKKFLKQIILLLKNFKIDEM